MWKLMRKLMRKLMQNLMSKAVKYHSRASVSFLISWGP